jgi:hypothetical protein
VGRTIYNDETINYTDDVLEKEFVQKHTEEGDDSW